ncbi:uncharacterized protein LOC144256522 [Urocitellus parryii]
MGDTLHLTARSLRGRGRCGVLRDREPREPQGERLRARQGICPLQSAGAGSRPRKTTSISTCTSTFWEEKCGSHWVPKDAIVKGTSIFLVAGPVWRAALISRSQTELGIHIHII